MEMPCSPDCKERTEDCHGQCEMYQKWLRHHIAEKHFYKRQIIRKQRADGFMVDMAESVLRKRKWRRRK